MVAVGAGEAEVAGEAEAALLAVTLTRQLPLAGLLLPLAAALLLPPPPLDTVAAPLALLLPLPAALSLRVVEGELLSLGLGLALVLAAALPLPGALGGAVEETLLLPAPPELALAAGEVEGQEDTEAAPLAPALTLAAALPLPGASVALPEGLALAVSMAPADSEAVEGALREMVWAEGCQCLPQGCCCWRCWQWGLGRLLVAAWPNPQSDAACSVSSPSVWENCGCAAALAEKRA
jgi:hypothetical protein